VKTFRKLGLPFFLFGQINNVMYELFVSTPAQSLPIVLCVLILSATLDLVPPSTPKGIIAFCNIAPSLAAKVAWPYLTNKGKVRYMRRLWGYAVLSTLVSSFLLTTCVLGSTWIRSVFRSSRRLMNCIFDSWGLRWLHSRRVRGLKTTRALRRADFPPTLNDIVTYAPSPVAAHFIGFVALIL